MTYEEYKALWEKLTEAQKNWVKAKCQWEHMGRGAVLNNWGAPDPKNLNEDGTWVLHES